jgi:hypothetical protein
MVRFTAIPPSPSQDRRFTRVLMLATACAAVIAMLGACGGGESDDEDIDTAPKAGDQSAAAAPVCLVKQTPPNQPPQPMPSHCTSKPARASDAWSSGAR